MTEQNNYGSLRIRTTTARGALPVEGAQVFISAADKSGGNTGVIASGRTDSAGLTETFMLPSPPIEDSQSPGMPTPFAKYHVEIYADGFYPVDNFDVPVFPGITSIQPADMIPLLEDGGEAG